MIILRLILKDYNWGVTILLECDCTDTEEVLDHLDSISCPINLLLEALNNLNSCNSNTGLTYSNVNKRRTVMVVNKTDSAKELLNTVTHECYHFILLFARANYIKDEETLATITGRFNMNLWEVMLHIIKSKI